MYSISLQQPEAMSNVNDKHGEPIKVGDHVYTPIRGGRHEGDVEKIVMDDDAAAQEGVKNPPKVRRSPVL